ncbi:MAG: T9SS type A sorting domain-containing protein [Cyclobacteriaceae bacterium]|nr:T9SS type A sorting domain-containing protein [Cyclobacteriaceae bacterium]
MKTKFFCLSIIYITLAFTVTAQTTFYVTPSGAGLMDGTSWGNAVSGQDLQTSINTAVVGDQVWVACGTYVPTTNTDRSISFAMKTGVAIYGSFQSTENTLEERNLTCGPCSILSGEIGNAGNADNSYTVIWNPSMDDTAILNGFVIRDGNDNRSPTTNGSGLGGGIYNHGYGSTGFSNPTIRNCVFTNNFAAFGAGAFNNGYNNGNSNPTYINCIFYANHAYNAAGAMDSYGVGGNSSPIIMNTLFYENTSATNVGAMYAWGGNAGGNSHPVLTNCVFANNSATNGFGGAFIADSRDESGGTTSGSCTVTLKNCILWNNTATGEGQQFYIRGTNSQVLATYSNIDMSGQAEPHIISGSQTGNLSLDPQFNDILNAIGLDGCWMTADDGLQLQQSSPCIDAGNNTDTYATDLLGNTRIMGGTVDMGVFEKSAVACNAPDMPNLTATSSSICSGSVVTISVDAGNELNDATNWQWYTNSCGGTPLSTGTSIDVSAETTTTYFVRGEGNCVTSGNCSSITITVSEPLELSVSATNEIAGNDGTIDLTVSGGIPPYTFDWDNDGTGDFDDTEDLSALAAGTYVVIVRDSLACEGTINVVIEAEVVAGFIEQGEKLALSIYPNPNPDGMVNINIPEGEKVVLNIRNSEGKFIANYTIYNKIELEVISLPKGLYFFEFEISGQKVIKQFIKR